MGIIIYIDLDRLQSWLKHTHTINWNYLIITGNGTLANLYAFRGSIETTHMKLMDSMWKCDVTGVMWSLHETTARPHGFENIIMMSVYIHVIMGHRMPKLLQMSFIHL